MEGGIDEKEIDRLCPAGRSTGSHEFLSLNKAVDQGGLAHIGPSSEGHFGKLIAGVMVRANRCLHKLRRGDHESIFHEDKAFRSGS